MSAWQKGLKLSWRWIAILRVAIAVVMLSVQLHQMLGQTNRDDVFTVCCECETPSIRRFQHAQCGHGCGIDRGIQLFLDHAFHLHLLVCAGLSESHQLAQAIDSVVQLISLKIETLDACFAG